MIHPKRGDDVSVNIYIGSLKILTSKPTGKRPLGKLRKDNNRMYLREISENKINWIDFAQIRNYWRSF